MMVGIVFESPYGNRASIIAKQKRDNTYNNIQQLDIYTNPQIQADRSMPDTPGKFHKRIISKWAGGGVISKLPTGPWGEVGGSI